MYCMVSNTPQVPHLHEFTVQGEENTSLSCSFLILLTLEIVAESMIIWINPYQFCWRGSPCFFTMIKTNIGVEFFL